jgi:hypothetical protein
VGLESGNGIATELKYSRVNAVHRGRKKLGLIVALLAPALCLANPPSTVMIRSAAPGSPGTAVVLDAPALQTITESPWGFGLYDCPSSCRPVDPMRTAFGPRLDLPTQFTRPNRTPPGQRRPDRTDRGGAARRDTNRRALQRTGRGWRRAQTLAPGGSTPSRVRQFGHEAL